MGLDSGYFEVEMYKEQREAGRWIPVTEPPKMFRGVIVYCPKYKNRYAAYLNARGEWYTFDPSAAGVKIEEVVTHWMEMPEPPKEDRR